MSEPLAVREAPAAYQVSPETQRVRPGYKQTEVGVIPEDWEVKLLPDVCHFRGGKAHEQYISGQGQYVCVNSKFISTDGIVRKYSTHNFCSANQNDILMVMSDLPNGKALAKAYLTEQSNMYAVNQRVCALTAYRDNPKYLFYVLNRNPYFLKFDNGVSQTHLLNNVFRDCLLPIPPNKAEQESIAEALSDADALIEALEQIVAKKRHLKQGTMQELLSGKKRLPGFSGEWEKKQIASFSVFVTKGATPTTYGFNWVDDGVRFLRSECVSAEGLDLMQSMFISEAAHKALLRGEVAAGDILITITGNVGRVVQLPPDFGVANINQHIARIRIKDANVSSDFVFHWLSQANVRSNYALITTGQAYPQISLKQVRETLVPLPTLSEQTAIATILSDMDTEIAALETRIAKTRELKQGMMHNLLTGKIRLL